MNDLRYPIGRYEPQPYSDELRKGWLSDIKFLPRLIEHAVINLDEPQLDTPYRDGGWTIKQVVHHVADSSMNAYCRFKLAMTEEAPVIKPYDEKAWAELEDVKTLPINISLTLIHALFARWHAAIEPLTEADWTARVMIHPDFEQALTLWYQLGNYAWHGKHHVAQITGLRERKGW